MTSKTPDRCCAWCLSTGVHRQGGSVLWDTHTHDAKHHSVPVCCPRQRTCRKSATKQTEQVRRGRAIADMDQGRALWGGDVSGEMIKRSWSCAKLSECDDPRGASTPPVWVTVRQPGWAGRGTVEKGCARWGQAACGWLWAVAGSVGFMLRTVGSYWRALHSMIRGYDSRS